MDRRIVPFKRWHYKWLTAVESAESLKFRLDERLLAEIEREYTRTWIVDGNPVCCAGLVQQWPGRHTAWAYLVRGTLPHMSWITPTARELIGAKPGRVEFTVRVDFPAGQRWARQLGFKVETPLLKAYGPEGEDHIGFVRFN